MGTDGRAVLGSVADVFFLPLLPAWADCYYHISYTTAARMVRLQPEKSCFCVPFSSFSLFPSRRWWRDSGCCVCPLVCPPLLFVCVPVPQGPRQTRRVVVRVMWVGLSCSIAPLVLPLCFGCCPTARRCPLSPAANVHRSQGRGRGYRLMFTVKQGYYIF